MKALFRIAIGLAVVLLGAGALMLLLSRPPGGAHAPVHPFDAAVLASSMVSADKPGFLGVVIAGESVDVAARMSGLVTAVRVRLGDEVAQDGIIATLDEKPLRSELAITQAALRAAVSAVQKTSLEVEEAKDRLARWERTAQAAVVSPEELAGLRYKVQYAAQELEAARARVAEQEARVKNLERQITDSVVRAPFGGRVAARYVDAGATVQHGQAIVRLMRAGDLRVRFAVPEDRGSEIRRGLAVEVRIDELSTAISGIVESVAPEVDAAARMIIAEARLESSGEQTLAPLAGRVARVHPRATIQPEAP